MSRTTMVEVRVLGPVTIPAAELAELGVHRSVECTVLEATVRDQAALYGLLQRLAALGLDLLELRTAAPGQRPDLEVVVRGPVGVLVQEMLHDIDQTVPAAITSYRVRDADLAGLLAVVSGLPAVSTDDGGPAAETSGAAIAVPTTASGSRDRDVTIAELRELATLHNQGVLTDAEFAAQKARILGS